MHAINGKKCHFYAKIDENFTNKEEEIIKQALKKISGDESDINNLIKKGKIIEENANQILDFKKY